MFRRTILVGSLAAAMLALGTLLGHAAAVGKLPFGAVQATEPAPAVTARTVAPAAGATRRFTALQDKRGQPQSQAIRVVQRRDRPMSRAAITPTNSSM